MGVFPAQTDRIMAQKVVDEIKAAHPEITSLELAASRSEQEGCKTIAATEAKEIGAQCDQDELTAIKTNKPFIEREKNEFDATEGPARWRGAHSSIHCCLKVRT